MKLNKVINPFAILQILILLSSLHAFPQTIKLGSDLLLEKKYEELINSNIGILCNNASRNSKGNHIIENLINSNIKPKKIFTPEHGFFSNYTAGQYVNDDSVFGIPAISLYGKYRKPTKSMLEGLDLIIIDLQDIGIRSYTYISSMYLMMQACAENKIKVIVLDRPNPLGGIIIDGGLPDKDSRSFVCIVPIPYIYGSTIGELALMINEEGWLSEDKSHKLSCELEILQLENWQRWMQWEDTGLSWFPTSPNIPTIDAIRGAAMIGIYGELQIFNIAIGKAIPFQYISFKNMKAKEIMQYFNSLDNYGVECIETPYGYEIPTDLINTNSLFLLFSNTNLFTPYQSGIRLMYAIRKYNPEIFKSNIKKSAISMFKKVTGSNIFFDKLLNSELEELLEFASYGIQDYLKIRKKYLLY